MIRGQGRSDEDMCELLTSRAVALALDEGPSRRGQGLGVPPSGNRSFIEYAVSFGISQCVQRFRLGGETEKGTLKAALSGIHTRPRRAIPVEESPLCDPGTRTKIDRHPDALHL